MPHSYTTYPAQQDEQPKRSTKKTPKPRRQRKSDESIPSLVPPSPAMAAPSLPATRTPVSATSAPEPSINSSPMTAPVSHAAPASSLSATPVPQAPTWSPLRPSYASYPGLTLQRAESFVRGSADWPPKLPTPPSERGGVLGPSPLEVFASTALEEEKYSRRGLPGIATLLAPLSPESPSVTPPQLLN